MSSICGIFERNGNKGRLDHIGDMVRALAHFGADGTGTWTNERKMAAMGHVMLFNTPESLTEKLPYHDPQIGRASCRERVS
jgi:asparagine synthetase B (glutamine-hydrolysing)